MVHFFFFFSISLRLLNKYILFWGIYAFIFTLFCVSVNECTENSEDNIGCRSLTSILFSTDSLLFSCHVGLAGPWASGDATVSIAMLLVGALGHGWLCFTFSFYVGPRDLNSGTHSCGGRSLNTQEANETNKTQNLRKLLKEGSQSSSPKLSKQLTGAGVKIFWPAELLETVRELQGCSPVRCHSCWAFQCCSCLWDVHVPVSNPWLCSYARLGRTLVCWWCLS